MIHKRWHTDVLNEACDFTEELDDSAGHRMNLSARPLKPGEWNAWDHLIQHEAFAALVLVDGLMNDDKGSLAKALESF